MNIYYFEDGEGDVIFIEASTPKEAIEKLNERYGENNPYYPIIQ